MIRILEILEVLYYIYHVKTGVHYYVFSIGRGPSSPDIGDPLIPPVEPSTSGDSSCSSDISAGNDNNLNGINDNNINQEFPLDGRQQHDLLHPMNGHAIDFNPPRLQWVSSTTWQIPNPSHPDPLHPTPNVPSLQQPSNPNLPLSVMQPNLGSPPSGLLTQNGIPNHGGLPAHAGIFGGHHTAGLNGIPNHGGLPTPAGIFGGHHTAGLNGIPNHGGLPAPAGIFGGHHTAGLTTANHSIHGPKQSRLAAPLPPSNDIPFSQLKRGRKLGQVRVYMMYVTVL